MICIRIVFLLCLIPVSVLVPGCSTSHGPNDREMQALKTEIARRQEMLSGRRLELTRLLAETGRLFKAIDAMRGERDVSGVEGAVERGRRTFYLDYLVILHDTIECYDSRIDSLEQQLLLLTREFMLERTQDGARPQERKSGR